VITSSEKEIYIPTRCMSSKKSADINFTKYSNYCNSYRYFLELSIRVIIQVNEFDTESDRVQYGTHWNHKNLTKFDRISSDGRTIPILIGSDIGFINLDQYYGRNKTVNDTVLIDLGIYKYGARLRKKPMLLRPKKKMSSNFRVYKFLVFSEIQPHSFNLPISDYADTDF